MKIKSLIILLIGCTIITMANAAVKKADAIDTPSKDESDRAALRAKFLNSGVSNGYNFEIVNKTDNNFADVIVQSDNGVTIYEQYMPKSAAETKSGLFSCAAHTTCQLKIANSKKKALGSWTFRFYG